MRQTLHKRMHPTSKKGRRGEDGGIKSAQKKEIGKEKIKKMEEKRRG